MNYVRICPVCKIEINYTNYGSFTNATRLNYNCKKCGLENRNKNPEWKQNIIKSSCKRWSNIEEREKQSKRKKGKCNGPNNPFFGEKHTSAAKKKIGMANKNFTKTKEFAEKISKTSKGTKNGMYGRSLFEIWVTKYGEKVAHQKMHDLCKKRSLNSSGYKNPMFGKPSPIGSGNGWSGWYKGWYFRSLHELAYMINVIEKNNYSWRNAEAKDLKIPYQYEGKDKYYFADFLIEERILIEIKPKRLQGSKVVLAKKKAAENFCKNKGYQYEIIDPVKLSDSEIVDLYNNKVIKFIDKYDKSFRTKFNL